MQLSLIPPLASVWAQGSLFLGPLPPVAFLHGPVKAGLAPGRGSELPSRPPAHGSRSRGAWWVNSPAPARDPACPRVLTRSPHPGYACPVCSRGPGTVRPLWLATWLPQTPVGAPSAQGHSPCRASALAPSRGAGARGARRQASGTLLVDRAHPSGPRDGGGAASRGSRWDRSSGTKSGDRPGAPDVFLPSSADVIRNNQRPPAPPALRTGPELRAMPRAGRIGGRQPAFLWLALLQLPLGRSGPPFGQLIRPRPSDSRRVAHSGVAPFAPWGGGGGPAVISWDT